ncbi:TPD1 protein homolog 1-like [Oryza brachyantha]|uniref:LGC1 n=1 Tax=Oryza brachyantha TaxID=4533 RepID=J3MRU3_ORYBR|nr:TPD1 protein homolog 1-like [Oryza brachyantha]
MDHQVKLLMILFACLLASISIKGQAEGCSLDNIAVSQSATGGWAHGQPEYAVTVSNTCGCPQSDVRVACDGFNTTLAVDPSKLRPAGGDLCLVNGGTPVVQGHDVTFSYAWSPQFKFTPVSSTLNC